MHISLLYFCSLLEQAVIVLVVETIGPVHPSFLQQVKTEKFVELRCEQAPTYFLMPICFNVVLILICAILGYLTRKLPENFNESWYIFVSVSTTLFAWSVFLPTYYTVFYAYQQQALLAFCLILNSLITIGCLFLPRVYAIMCVEEQAMDIMTMNTKVSTVGPQAVSTHCGSMQ